MAIIAVARKLAVIAWHLLTKDQDYRDARPDLVRVKNRALRGHRMQPQPAYDIVRDRLRHARTGGATAVAPPA